MGEKDLIFYYKKNTIIVKKKKKKATSTEYIWSFSPSALPHLGSYRSQWYASSQLSVLGSCTCFLFYFFSFTGLLLPTHLPPPSCTHAQSCNPMDCSLPGSSVNFSRQGYWSGLPFPSRSCFLNKNRNRTYFHAFYSFTDNAYVADIFPITRIFLPPSF